MPEGQLKHLPRRRRPLHSRARWVGGDELAGEFTPALRIAADNSAVPGSQVRQRGPRREAAHQPTIVATLRPSRIVVGQSELGMSASISGAGR